MHLFVQFSAAGTAVYLGTLAKNSFSAYSSEQLDLLERELEQELKPEHVPGRSPRASGPQAEQKERLALAISEAFVQIEGIPFDAAALGAWSDSASRIGSSTSSTNRRRPGSQPTVETVVRRCVTPRSGRQRAAATTLSIAQKHTACSTWNQGPSRLGDSGSAS